MSLDRQIVRLMAAMILAIIAYVAPSAVQAHEGHAHHSHHMAAAQPTVLPSTAKAAVSSVVAAPWLVAQAAVRTWSKVALTVTDGASIEPSGDDCCPIGCKTRCCGTMTCCATGVLSGPYTVSPSLFRTVTLIPRDVAGRAGIDPEALPKPPRTLA